VTCEKVWNSLYWIHSSVVTEVKYRM